MKYIEVKIDSLDVQIENLKADKELLKKQNIKANKRQGIKQWIGYTFESSTGPTEEFLQFTRDFKEALNKQIKDKFELVSFDRGHFYISGFLQNKITNKMVYFSSGDVRFFKDNWYVNLLIRTAKDNKDYTGGSNNETTFENIGQKAEQLTA